MRIQDKSKAIQDNGPANQDTSPVIKDCSPVIQHRIRGYRTKVRDSSPTDYIYMNDYYTGEKNQ